MWLFLFAEIPPLAIKETCLEEGYALGIFFESNHQFFEVAIRFPKIFAVTAGMDR